MADVPAAFDIEHTFRLFKQTLGWTAPKVRTPQAADRWTAMIVAVYPQLRLAVSQVRHRSAELDAGLPAGALADYVSSRDADGSHHGTPTAMART